MFILGNLITIPETELRLPLPWWHRAPLAFESKTNVTLGLTAPKEDRPGDLLVSAINSDLWEQSWRIRCLYKDGPGIVAQVFSLTANHYWNVAVAETVTVDGGRNHALDLICEPKSGLQKISRINPLITDL